MNTFIGGGDDFFLDFDESSKFAKPHDQYNIHKK